LGELQRFFKRKIWVKKYKNIQSDGPLWDQIGGMTYEPRISIYL